ncbi:protein-glutamate methylesterase/protein-glutamine glutaminase [Aliidiomarina celeris]|uniref:protein-glutamate methylesterase/protein-glutamine glutaminase n=1 Tax=Aliidiomarina celeris TaxID=2249428 RepID=UPI000DE9D4EF|nr:chemotaxis response regulator protein-glutamate methylesterase [Aliidiomarina celeris]
MTVRVLVVDDSNFFRRRVTEILNEAPNLEVIDTAADGAEAVRKARELKPDVITMDIEMPVLDGISAVRQIMAERSTPILMFSSLTHDGAQATLDALDAGAVDFLPKKFEDIARNRGEAVQILQQRVYEIGRRRSSPMPSRPAPSTSGTQPRFSSRPGLGNRFSSSDVTARSGRFSGQASERTEPASESAREPTREASTTIPKVERSTPYKLLAIGTSTGGPVALQTVLTALPADFPVPIVLVQHMPAAFTKAFAARLDGLCKISVKEAEDNDALQPGHAYLAPGGKQMIVDGRAGAARLRIREDSNDKLTYKPSVDLTFASIARVYGGDSLGVILTGMGADGREGARMMKERGSTIWAQDKDTCVVYGMPQAVAVAGISERDIPLPEVARHILRAFERS